MQNDRVGKYRIIAKLGQGGMATVYLSIVPGPAGFNKLLVVKLLKEELVHDPDFLSMFLNEARLAARLNHANVVHTYEVGTDGDQQFLVMDYLDGQPLHAILRRVRREKMPLDVHVRILADMLAGLHYAHTLTDFDGTPLHVVHRDVSPQNVFVTYDGQVKVVDFGIAKAAGATSTTQSGVFKGKMSYVAPEQAGGDTIDARADIFSVGVMLWEAMAGRKFAQGDGQGAVLARRLAGAEPRIRDVVPDADPELAEICDRAMAHKKEDRYANALEFRDALENFLERFSRRIGSREVGEFVTQLFADERAQIRQIIDEQMKRVLRETSQALPLPMLDLHTSSGDPTPLTSKNLHRADDARAHRARSRAAPDRARQPTERCDGRPWNSRHRAHQPGATGDLRHEQDDPARARLARLRLGPRRRLRRRPAEAQAPPPPRRAQRAPSRAARRAPSTSR
jgi:eukaryotic-like serine/threonine-protein kinase